mmetsp:Transcript_2795/g.4290  ORF Transcript_2795/g.4290 Transcript_2795/m.4290 type:complete len:641 (-) Transcript_2795:122-2044(-)
MASYRSMALAFLLGTIAGCTAFTPSTVSTTSVSSTSLQAVAPPLIIGPMIRKMREDQAKKKMPMASDEETFAEAPGLRVGTGAWKWPPVWPYDDSMFKRKEEVEKQNSMTPMQSMLASGAMANPEAPTDGKDEFDPLKYWGSDKAGVDTELNAETASKLTSHYSFYLQDGMSVVEFGAAEKSYLPEGLKLGRHVGVGASSSQMEKNPALTESFVVDLNNVVPEFDVDSDDIRQLGNDTFDVVLMANTIDFLTNPREVFRTGWNLLKPGGTMIVAFTSRDAYVDKFAKAQTKMWRDMNDDQHTWICGSFFQFSAGEGWEGLKGFDISPEEAASDDSIFSKISNAQKPANIYVVQATKVTPEESIDESNPAKSFSSRMWMLPTMEERDKQLVAPRLARAYLASSDENDREKIASHVDTLPRIYESLVKMDQFAFTFSMQARLAADLVSDPDYVGNDEQIANMKMGLGLRKPSENFWQPVGEATGNMDPEDKVNLLAHIVPRFGSGNPEQEAALETFVTGLKPAIAVVKSKCTGMSDSDAQLVGSELLAAEVLKPGRSTREEFAAWLNELTEAELTEYATRRKSFKKNALNELKEYQDKQQADKDELERKRGIYQEQVQKARKERTMYFNDKTGKVEEVPKKK